jgi:hypothetical protein
VPGGVEAADVGEPIGGSGDANGVKSALAGNSRAGAAMLGVDPPGAAAMRMEGVFGADEFREGAAEMVGDGGTSTRGKGTSVSSERSD